MKNGLILLLVFIGILLFISTVSFIWGLINPEYILNKEPLKNRTRYMVITRLGSVLLFFIILFVTLFLIILFKY